MVAAVALMLVAFGPTGSALGPSSGVLAQYYDGKGTSGPLLLETFEPFVYNFWGFGGPPGTGELDTFTAVYSGSVVATVSGAYTFLSHHDDGVRLTVDGVVLYDHWDHIHPTSIVQSGPVYLTAGAAVPFVLEYYENFGIAAVSLMWKPPSFTVPQVIPAGNLEPPVPPDNTPPTLTVDRPAPGTLNADTTTLATPAAAWSQKDCMAAFKSTHPFACPAFHKAWRSGALAAPTAGVYGPTTVQATASDETELAAVTAAVNGVPLTLLGITGAVHAWHLDPATFAATKDGTPATLVVTATDAAGNAATATTELMLFAWHGNGEGPAGKAGKP